MSTIGFHLPSQKEKSKDDESKTRLSMLPDEIWMDQAARLKVKMFASVPESSSRVLVVDSNDASAFPSLTDAVAEASDGDEIVIKGGTYDEEPIEFVGKQRVVIRAFNPRESPVSISFRGHAYARVAMDISAGSFIFFHGITIRANGEEIEQLVHVSSTGVVAFANCQLFGSQYASTFSCNLGNAHFQHCRLIANGADACIVESGSVSFVDCSIENCRNGLISGIALPPSEIEKRDIYLRSRVLFRRTYFNGCEVAIRSQYAVRVFLVNSAIRCIGNGVGIGMCSEGERNLFLLDSMIDCQAAANQFVEFTAGNFVAGNKSILEVSPDPKLRQECAKQDEIWNSYQASSLASYANVSAFPSDLASLHNSSFIVPSSSSSAPASSSSPASSDSLRSTYADPAASGASFSGFLDKLGGSRPGIFSTKNWKRRFFRIRDSSLSYATGESESDKVLDTIFLEGGRVYRVDGKDSRIHFELSVEYNGTQRKMQLAARAEDDARRVFAALKLAGCTVEI